MIHNIFDSLRSLINLHEDKSGDDLPDDQEDYIIDCDLGSKCNNSDDYLCENSDLAEILS